jgi:hypothetical protein
MAADRLHPDRGLGADRARTQTIRGDVREARDQAGRFGAGLLEGERVEGHAVKRITDGVAFLFKANGVQWLKGTGTFKDAACWRRVRRGRELRLGDHRHRLRPTVARDRRAQPRSVRRLRGDARSERGAGRRLVILGGAVGHGARGARPPQDCPVDRAARAPRPGERRPARRCRGRGPAATAVHR